MAARGGLPKACPEPKCREYPAATPWIHAKRRSFRSSGLLANLPDECELIACLGSSELISEPSAKPSAVCCASKGRRSAATS